MKNNRQHSLLLVDDDKIDRIVLRDLIGDTYMLREVASSSEAEAAIEAQRPDCIILDYHIPGTQTLDLLTAWAERGLAVIMMTGQGNEGIAVEAMKRGAEDYFSKGDFTGEAIQRAIENTVEKSRLKRLLADRQEELESFVSVASHDLKAPLRRIEQFGALLQTDCDNGRQDRMGRYIERISGSARQMRQLLDALREYSLFGRGNTELQSVDLESVLATVLGNLEVALKECDAQVKAAPLPVVWGDEVALVQLFQNLISNAITYQADHTPQIDITAEAKEAGWMIAIKDNGIGIKPADQQRIFEPFKRLHTQQEFSGTGIGLATCKKIVEQHNGKLWVESEAGAGASFFITLSAAPAGVLDQNGP